MFFYCCECAQREFGFIALNYLLVVALWLFVIVYFVSVLYCYIEWLWCCESVYVCALWLSFVLCRCCSSSSSSSNNNLLLSFVLY